MDERAGEEFREFMPGRWPAVVRLAYGLTDDRATPRTGADRHRRAGDHRTLPGRGRPGRGAGGHQPHDRLGVIYGTVFGAVLFVSIPVLPLIFSAGPDVRQVLGPVLVVAALQQPIAGVVFVLDGVLIGDYLALAGLAAAAVFAATAVVVNAWHGGLVSLWLAFTVWLLARFATLTLRTRGQRWLVTGAVRP